MGRKSMNRTYEELLEIKRIRANKYYSLHKEDVKKKARDRYALLKRSEQ